MKTANRLPDFVEPMKAKLLDSKPVGAWIYEPLERSFLINTISTSK